MRSGARPANLADLREVLLHEVLEDIHGSLGECDSPQCGGNASAGENGMCADAPLTAAGRGHSYGEREGFDTVDRKSIRIGSRESHLGGNDPRDSSDSQIRGGRRSERNGVSSPNKRVNLFVDKQGKLWLNGNTDLYCLQQGAHVFQMRKLPHRWVVRQTADGTFWLLEETKGVRAVSGPLAEIYDGSKAALRFSIGTQLLVDREGSFWMSVAEQGGVRRVSKPEQLLGRIVEFDQRPHREIH